MIYVAIYATNRISLETPMCAEKYPDNKIHGANMGPTWVLLAPGGPHVGPINLVIRVYNVDVKIWMSNQTHRKYEIGFYLSMPQL